MLATDLYSAYASLAFALPPPRASRLPPHRHSSPLLSSPALPCRYRISDNVNLPFRVIPVIEEQGKTRVVLNIKAIANFSNQLFATNVTFKIPVSAAGGAKAYVG